MYFAVCSYFLAVPLRSLSCVGSCIEINKLRNELSTETFLVAIWPKYDLYVLPARRANVYVNKWNEREKCRVYTLQQTNTVES